jgi:hypothetical protein
MAFSTEFSTRKYELSHGRKPKGTGSWAFLVMQGRTEVETVFVPGSMSLADAKTWMRSYGRTSYSQSTDFLEVEVAP